MEFPGLRGEPWWGRDESFTQMVIDVHQVPDEDQNKTSKRFSASVGAKQYDPVAVLVPFRKPRLRHNLNHPDPEKYPQKLANVPQNVSPWKRHKKGPRLF